MSSDEESRTEVAGPIQSIDQQNSGEYMLK